MKLALHTLTPLWTGGIETGRMDRIHETSVLGSLRWWYEVIVRGLDKNACDPSSNNRCPLTIKTRKTSQEVRCVACDLFGCTSWSRRFRLRLEDGLPVYTQQDSKDLINIKPSGRKRGWWFGAGQMGFGSNDPQVGGQLVVLRGSESAVINQLLVPLALINNWGAIGARTQHGYGVVKVTVVRDQQVLVPALDAFFKYIKDQEPIASKAINADAAPRLDQFFFSRFWFDLPTNWWQDVDGLETTIQKQLNQLSKQIRSGKQQAKQKQLQRAINDLNDDLKQLKEWIGSKGRAVPVAPAIKNQLRFNTTFMPTLRANYQDQEELFGTAPRNKKSSRIHISPTYQRADGKWEIRIWGWIPNTIQNRDQILDELYSALTSNSLWSKVFGTSNSTVNYEWKEIGNPSRCKPPYLQPCNTTRDFIRCLIGDRS